jgi:hypothetical protein
MVVTDRASNALRDSTQADAETLCPAGSQVGCEQPPETAPLEADRRLHPQAWIEIVGMTAGTPLAGRTVLGRLFGVRAPRRREEFELAPAPGTSDAVGEGCVGQNVWEAHAVTSSRSVPFGEETVSELVT